MIQLELLSNELLLELFGFLDTAHLLQAFFGLNYRFNQLVYSHLRDQLSFESISKENFDVICQQYLPFLIDQVRSLCLSNKETSDLSGLLLSRGFTLNRFIHLQSLSLYNIHSLDQLQKITFQCRSLPHLLHLNIIKCHVFELREYILFESLNNIWRIPTLTHCNLNGIHGSEQWVWKISEISPSIEYLSIEHTECEIRSLSHLFTCTPHLKSLSTAARSSSSDERLEFVIPSMKSLKLFVRGSASSLKNIFQTMPNICHLTVETSQMYLDGHAWEQIITSYFPKIKVFRLKMKLQFEYNNNSMIENIDELLLTFRTAFWLEEHRWFVRCDCDPSDSLRPTIVYTLPYAFNDYCYSNELRSKSTCLDEEDHWSYDSVQTISFMNNGMTSFDTHSLLHSHFPNIRHLDISFPLDDNFSLLFPSLNRLTSLNVYVCRDCSYHHLQILIDQAPFLYSLKLNPAQRLQSQLFQLTSKSIRRLEFKYTPSTYSNHFSTEDCFNLISSPLGLQCEVLLICLTSRINTLDLIRKMPHLRLLIFKCEDDKEFFRNLSLRHDELAQWLRNHLPSSYSIIRDPRTFDNRVWIDRHKKERLLSNNDILTVEQHNKFSRFLSSMKRVFS